MEPIHESNQLQSIFPEEIWLLIGEKISQVEDHLHLRDSSQYFCNLFKSLLDRAMFPEVAKILNAQFMRYPGEKPKLHPVLGKCRLICRHWQKSVDAVLQNLPDPLRRNWFGPIDFLINMERPPDVRMGGQRNDLARFRQHFAETHAGANRNPFASRTISIYYGPEYIEDLIDEILNFLREYGQHIWHCYIFLVTNESWNIPLIIYRKLYEMLELMPNLLTLSLSCLLLWYRHEAIVSDDLKTFFTTHPFPTLKHLKFQHIRRLPTLLSRSLMRANPQITVLNDVYPSTNVKTVSFQEHLPQLEQLTTSLNNKQQFIALKNLNLNWPLSKLHLQISSETTTKALFRILGKHWSATLTQLTLTFWKDREFLDVVPLKLPNLQVFAIQSLSFAPLDFLLPAKSSLKKVSVLVNTIDLPDSDDRLQSALAAESAVKFLNFRNNLIDSNIWSVFPKLRSVDYKEVADYKVDWDRKPLICQRLEWMLKQNENI